MIGAPAEVRSWKRAGSSAEMQPLGLPLRPACIRVSAWGLLLDSDTVSVGPAVRIGARVHLVLGTVSEAELWGTVNTEGVGLRVSVGLRVRVGMTSQKAVTSCARLRVGTEAGVGF